MIFHEFGTSRREIRQTRREILGKRFIVGPVLGADGSTPATGRQAKTGESAVSQVHGEYFEPASRGVLAFASDQGAGIATNTSIGTTAIFSLYNPINSSKRLAISKVSLGYFSGTLGAGPVYHCVTPQVSGVASTQPTGGVSLTSYWSNIYNLSLSANPIGLARTGSTVVTPVVYRHFCSLFAELASTANGIQACTEELNGEIVLEPGGSYQLQSVCATGTTPKITVGIMWEEVPYVASQG